MTGAVQSTVCLADTPYLIVIHLIITVQNLLTFRAAVCKCRLLTKHLTQS